MKNTKRIALSGILAAMSVAVIYVGTVSELFSYSGCLLSAFIILFLKIEFGTASAASVYGVVSVLSWLLLPDKSVAAIYTFVAGLYPLFKSYFDRITNSFVRWACKLAAYNTVVAALYFAALAFFSPEIDAPWLIASVLLLANAVFVFSDLLADRLTLLYNVKFRPMLRRRGIL